MTEHAFGIEVEHGPKIQRRSLGPAFQRGHDAVVGDAHVQRQRQGFGSQILQPAAHGLRRGDGQRADHHPGDPGLSQPHDILARANAAAGLDAGASGPGQTRQGFVLHRATGLGAVQIDDVDPLGSGVGKGIQARDRVVVIAGDLIKAPVHQPHADAVLQVDGGIEDHASIARKLDRMRAPVVDDRSGWNWQPQRLPCRTMAGKGVPWRARASVAGPSEQAKPCTK